jgi:hypothetical protein
MGEVSYPATGSAHIYKLPRSQDQTRQLEVLKYESDEDDDDDQGGGESDGTE